MIASDSNKNNLIIINIAFFIFLRSRHIYAFTKLEKLLLKLQTLSAHVALISDKKALIIRHNEALRSKLHI